MGEADVPAQGATVGQLLGLIPAEADKGEALDQGQLWWWGGGLASNKII